jgi:hypothetical protein
MTSVKEHDPFISDQIIQIEKEGSYHFNQYTFEKSHDTTDSLSKYIGRIS